MTLCDHTRTDPDIRQCGELLNQVMRHGCVQAVASHNEADPIRSYLIPHDIWLSGWSDLPHLPAVALPARDALEIERRFRKEMNLRNEVRRYTVCCERIQGIVRDLALGGALITHSCLTQTLCCRIIVVYGFLAKSFS